MSFKTTAFSTIWLYVNVYMYMYTSLYGLLWCFSGKESTCNAGNES